MSKDPRSRSSCLHSVACESCRPDPSPQMGLFEKFSSHEMVVLVPGAKNIDAFQPQAVRLQKAKGPKTNLLTWRFFVHSEHDGRKSTGLSDFGGSPFKESTSPSSFFWERKTKFAVVQRERLAERLLQQVRSWRRYVRAFQ